MGLTYISSVTASSSATLEFTSGIDSSYNEFQFHCINMHGIDDNANFGFQVNAHDGSSQLTGFNELITSAGYKTGHKENDSVTELARLDNINQAEGNAYQPILAHESGNDDDQSTSGILTLYDPASATYVKHFISVGSGSQAADSAQSNGIGGYINTTNAITQISFKFSSGNIESGSIHMYGVG